MACTGETDNRLECIVWPPIYLVNRFFSSKFSPLFYKRCGLIFGENLPFQGHLGSAFAAGNNSPCKNMLRQTCSLQKCFLQVAGNRQESTRQKPLELYVGYFLSTNGE